MPIGLSAFAFRQHIKFAFLLKQFYFHGLSHLLPGQIQPLLFVLLHLAFGSSHQIENLPRPIPHLLQYLFARNAPVHHPHPFGFAIGLLDLVQKLAQRCAITGIAIQDFVGQWKTIRGDHQGNHHLQTIRPLIATVTVLGFGVLFHRAFKVRTGQVVEEYLEFRMKQIGPFLA
jgi:hypothetical protein